MIFRGGRARYWANTRRPARLGPAVGAGPGVILVALAAAVAGACGAPGGPGTGIGTPATVSAALNVPEGVKCVRVAGEGAGETVVRDFDVTAGERPELTILGLPEGSVTITAEAFDSKCSNATGDPSHVTSTSVIVDVYPGVVVHVDLVLRPNRGVGAQVSFLEPAVEIACGGRTAYARLADGSVVSWGDDSLGQLGRGDEAGFVPAAVPTLHGVVKITAGEDHACALLGTGQVRCWGANVWGQLGDGSFTGRSTPVSVTALAAVSRISAGGDHTCAVEKDSDLARCWGRNTHGQLGDAAFPNSSSPTPLFVGGPHRLLDSVSAGRYHTCGITRAREVACWGRDTSGQLGSSQTDVLSANPLLAEGMTFSLDLAGMNIASGSCAKRVDDSWSCWGNGLNGALGAGSTPPGPLPGVVANWNGATQIALGVAHGCGRFDDGRVRCTGNNSWGELGAALLDDYSLTPVSVVGVSDATQTCVGFGYSCALIRDGRVFCWGWNGNGQLGDGTRIDSPLPVEVQLAVPPPPPPPEEIDPAAFANPTVINFDSRTAGEPIETQYRAQGVTFANDAKRTPTIQAASFLKVFTDTSPNVLYNVPGTQATEAPLTMQFDPVVRRVGFWMGGGGLDPTIAGKVTAYDGNGAVILQVSRQEVAVNLNEDFVGIDAGEAKIAFVEIAYASVEYPVIIDGLMLE